MSGNTGGIKVEALAKVAASAATTDQSHNFIAEKVL
jgi:hypothetical protein